MRLTACHLAAVPVTVVLICGRLASLALSRQKQRFARWYGGAADADVDFDH